MENLLPAPNAWILSTNSVKLMKALYVPFEK